MLDSGMQRVQSLLARALTAALEMLNTVGSNATSPLEDHLARMNNLVRGISQAFSSMNQLRKENVRNDAGDPIGRLCTWDYKVGRDLLFGGEVGKTVRDRDSARLRLCKKKFSSSR